MSGPERARSGADAPSPARRARAEPPSVQSVDRTLDIVELLAAADGPLGVVAIAEAAELAPGTTHRLLTTLLRRGWVRQDRDRRYALGSAMLRFGDTLQRQLVSTAHGFLEKAVAATGETANLAVLEGDHVVYVDQVPSPHRLRTFAEVGNRVPLHSTAVGKVIVAHLSEEAALASLGRAGLPARTSLTITDLTRFRDEIAGVRRLGYAVDDGEEADGVFCVAVPVHGPAAGLWCALSVSAPVSRVSAAQAPEVAHLLGAVAGELASAIGGERAG